MVGKPRLFGRWPVGALCLALIACSGHSAEPAGGIAAPDTRAADAAPSAAPSSPPTPATVLSDANGVLRVQLDALAYAPLVQAALNEGDEDAWRHALPSPRFAVHRRIDTGGVCDGGDRVVRYEDSDARNTVELRACQDGESPAFLAGFSFQDEVVAMARGLAPGATRMAVLAALGLPAATDGIGTIDIVNEEQNSTLRLHFDDDGRLRQVDYDPYTG